MWLNLVPPLHNPISIIIQYSSTECVDVCTFRLVRTMLHFVVVIVVAFWFFFSLQFCVYMLLDCVCVPSREIRTTLWKLIGVRKIRLMFTIKINTMWSNRIIRCWSWLCRFTIYINRNKPIIYNCSI